MNLFTFHFRLLYCKNGSNGKTNESERVSKQEIEMAEGFIEKTCDKLSHSCETIGEEISSIDCSRVSGGGGSGDGVELPLEVLLFYVWLQ